MNRDLVCPLIIGPAVWDQGRTQGGGIGKV